MTYDAIVIGAGHHGLILATYMAKAGLKVLNRTGNRGGCLVKVKQVPQPILQVVDSIFLQLQPVGCLRSIRASAGG